jgi:hypothetical protein
MITDETFGHKVKVHENLFNMHGNRKTGKIPFHAVSESLVGALFACQQADLLVSCILYHIIMIQWSVLTNPAKILVWVVILALLNCLLKILTTHH